MSQQSPAPLSHAAEVRASISIYAAGSSYQGTQGMVSILVPLYALHLGFAIDELGIIIASQAVFGLSLRVFGGAICDQFGERWVLWFSFSTLIIGAAVFGLSDDFWGLILAQTFIGFSRANYWTSSHSYASRISAERASSLLGRLNASGYAGTMTGTFLGGVLAGTLGYGAAWSAVVAIGLMAFLGSLALPELPRKQGRRGFGQAVASVPTMARSKGMGMGGYAAFVASMSVSLGVILIVPYLKEIGYEETLVGTARTITGLGSFSLGLVFGRIVSRLGTQNLYVAGFGLQGLFMLTLPQVGDSPAIIFVLMFAYGVFHGIMGILYTVTASVHSVPELRGMAMAYVGLYWGVGQLVVPAAFGVIAAAIGISSSFWIAGGILITAAISIPFVFPYLTRVRESTMTEAVV